MDIRSYNGRLHVYYRIMLGRMPPIERYSDPLISFVLVATMVVGIPLAIGEAVTFGYLWQAVARFQTVETIQLPGFHPLWIVDVDELAPWPARIHE